VIETEEDIDYEIEHTISNKEAMYDMIHSIHNFIRNNGGGYGMTALKCFSLLYGLCKIELNGHFKKTGLSDNCKFSYIKQKFDENVETGWELLIDDIVNDEIYNSDKVKYFLADTFPTTMSPKDVKRLINMIDKLCQMEVELNFQLAGKIYEYFIGRDQSAIQELGAYFTDRPITNYIYEDLLKPELDENGNVPTMIDMFGGSGGFTIGYLNYLNTHNDIDWSKQLNSVYHFDMNIDVVRYAMLEFYCITGQFPSKDNMASTNSFTSEFNKKKFKYICTNPPYGGDKIEKTEEIIISEIIKKEIQEYFKQKYKIKTMKQISKFEITDKKEKIKLKQYEYVYDKIKEFEKEKEKKTVNLNNSANRFKEYAKENKINGSKCKDKEAVSFLMMMDMLDEGGTAVGVLKEGLFFDIKYKHLREHLIENFNVSKVVSIDASQFENTTTKTSIIMFSNTGKTEKIDFYELVIDKDLKTTIEEDDNGVYVMKTMEGRINSVSDKFLTSATYEDIVKNEYTLNHKKYNKVELKPGDGYKMVKLGDVVDFLPKSKRLANFANDTGKYRYYSSGSKILKCDKADYKDKDIIIIGHSGEGCIFYDNTFSTLLTNHLLYNENKYMLKYIYYDLLSLWKEFYYSSYDGSTVKNTSDKNITIFKVPIPEDEQKMIEWVKKIDKPYNKIQECKNKIKELEAQVQTDIQKLLDENETEEVALGELCELNTGIYISKNKFVKGVYPVIGGGNITKYINKYNRENDFIINKDGISKDCIKYIPGKFFLNHHGWTFIMKNNESKKYLYYKLINVMEYIYNLSASSNQKGINQKSFYNFKITLPKDRTKIDTLNPLFEEIDKYNDELPKQEEKYNKYLQQLRQEAIKE
jgi:type I restriction-modification system DNA methylase subunit